MAGKIIYADNFALFSGKQLMFRRQLGGNVNPSNSLGLPLNHYMPDTYLSFNGYQDVLCVITDNVTEEITRVEVAIQMGPTRATANPNTGNIEAFGFLLGSILQNQNIITFMGTLFEEQQPLVNCMVRMVAERQEGSTSLYDCYLVTDIGHKLFVPGVNFRYRDNMRTVRANITTTSSQTFASMATHIKAVIVAINTPQGTMLKDPQIRKALLTTSNNTGFVPHGAANEVAATDKTNTELTPRISASEPDATITYGLGEPMPVAALTYVQSTIATSSELMTGCLKVESDTGDVMHVAAAARNDLELGKNVSMPRVIRGLPTISMSQPQARVISQWHIEDYPANAYRDNNVEIYPTQIPEQVGGTLWVFQSKGRLIVNKVGNDVGLHLNEPSGMLTTVQEYYLRSLGFRPLGDWCLEFTLRTLQLPASATPVAFIGLTSGASSVIYVDVLQTGVYRVQGVTTINLPSLTSGKNHLALSCKQGVVTIYLNGVNVGTTNARDYSVTWFLGLGAVNNSTSQGRIVYNDLRMTLDSPVYTENFTPTFPYPPVP